MKKLFDELYRIFTCRSRRKKYASKIDELNAEAELQDELRRARFNAELAAKMEVHIVSGKEPGTTEELKTKGYFDKLGRITLISYVGDESGFIRGVKIADERAEKDRIEELKGKK